MSFGNALQYHFSEMSSYSCVGFEFQWSVFIDLQWNDTEDLSISKTVDQLMQRFRHSVPRVLVQNGESASYTVEKYECGTIWIHWHSSAISGDKNGKAIALTKLSTSCLCNGLGILYLYKGLQCVV